MVVILLALSVGVGVLCAQSGAQPGVRPGVVPRGATVPAACTVGDLFFRTASTIALHECAATDTWTASALAATTFAGYGISDTSANLAAAITNETGTGLLVFGTSPTLTTPLFAGTTPSVANVGANSCGTTAATIAGNEISGKITVGATAGTQCRVTFTQVATTARECVATDGTTTVATRATYVDTTHTDFFGAFVAGDVIAYICIAR